MEPTAFSPRRHKRSKRQKWVNFLFSPLYFVFVNLFLEITFHLFVFGNVRIIYPVLLSVPTGIIAGLVCDLFNEKTAKILRYVFTALIFLVFSVQTVYFRVFKSIMPVGFVTMAGDVAGTFLKDAFLGIWQSLPKIIVYAIPFFVLWFAEKKLCPLSRRRVKNIILTATVFVIVQIIALISLPIGSTGKNSAYDLYYGKWNLDLGAEKLGIVSSTLLETKYTIFGGNDEGGSDLKIVTVPPVDDETEPDATDITTDTESGDEPKVPTNPLNTIEGLDFKKLAENESDPTVKAFFEYVNALEPTKKNEYTGLFKGYNLIMLCAESFSPMAIDENLTPTLYRLANSGFVFDNYWTCFESATTNGEYSFLTGLFPDFSKPKKDGSFLYSATNGNTMNMTISSWFNAQGVTSRAYHPHTGNYYSRNLTHPNLGYTFKAKEDYPNLTGWPESDLVLAQNITGEFINDDVFHTYIMTVSGHHNYKFGGYNDIADKNKSLVENLDLPDYAKAYLAVNIELDKALDYLIKELEKAGKLDKTVFCLSTDHYPYGLEDAEYASMLGYSKPSSMKYDRMERYKSTLILWNNKLETKHVSKPCCTVDVLPTLLNLFGFEYDSRLYSGQDILSSSYGLAILKNGSFITDKIAYNARYDLTYKIDKSFKIPDGYVEAYQQIVQNRFSVASDILNYDIYSKLPQDIISAAQKNKE